MKLELLIDSTEFWPRLREDILSARHSVRVQTYSFEGDRAGKMLAEALLSIESVDVDILVDSCRLSGMQDDAINCHGTFLRIIGKTGDNQLLMRFMHPQTYGFAAFAPGDEVAVIRHSCPPTVFVCGS